MITNNNYFSVFLEWACDNEFIYKQTCCVGEHNNSFKFCVWLKIDQYAELEHCNTEGVIWAVYYRFLSHLMLLWVDQSESRIQVCLKINIYERFCLLNCLFQIYRTLFHHVSESSISPSLPLSHRLYGTVLTLHIDLL